jgi:hypothetical protein
MIIKIAGRMIDTSKYTSISRDIDGTEYRIKFTIHLATEYYLRFYTEEDRDIAYAEIEAALNPVQIPSNNVIGWTPSE